MGGSHYNVVSQGKIILPKIYTCSNPKRSSFQGSYPLYWIIQDILPNGNIVEIVCTEMTIKLI